MRIRNRLAIAAVTGIAAISGPSALALDNIIKPYQGVRGAGMGGVKLTTGLYDENFFGNPARAAANPIWKVQILELSGETTSSTMSNVSKIADGGDEVLANLASTSGTNNHVRFQTVFPGAFYLPHLGSENKLSIAFALIQSTQADIDLRKSFQVDPQVVVDAGPALTVAHKFLEENALTVGVTTHVTYRVSSKEGYTFTDLLKGASLSPAKSGGDGTHLDFDLGGTYVLPIKPLDWELTGGLAFNNLLGGKYSNIGTKIADLPNPARQQPRTLGFGMAARKPSLWKFDEPVFALEFQDIGNNPNGSLFRTVHLGGEVRFGVLRPRLGLNQGYIAAGLGVDFKVVNLDIATYGEEMSLNVGGLQDRRIAFRLGIQI